MTKKYISYNMVMMPLYFLCLLLSYNLCSATANLCSATAHESLFCSALPSEEDLQVIFPQSVLMKPCGSVCGSSGHAMGDRFNLIDQEANLLGVDIPTGITFASYEQIQFVYRRCAAREVDFFANLSIRMDGNKAVCYAKECRPFTDKPLFSYDATSAAMEDMREYCFRSCPEGWQIVFSMPRSDCGENVYLFLRIDKKDLCSLEVSLCVKKQGLSIETQDSKAIDLKDFPLRQRR